MPWKIHFGFKLSNEGRQRALELARTLGYIVTETGWDYIIIQRQITDLERDTLLNLLFKNLFWQEEVVAERVQA